MCIGLNKHDNQLKYLELYLNQELKINDNDTSNTEKNTEIIPVEAEEPDQLNNDSTEPGGSSADSEQPSSKNDLNHPKSMKLKIMQKMKESETRTV